MFLYLKPKYNKGAMHKQKFNFWGPTAFSFSHGIFRVRRNSHNTLTGSSVSSIYFPFEVVYFPVKV